MLLTMLVLFLGYTDTTDEIVVHWLMKNDHEKLTALQCNPLCSRHYLLMQ